MVLEHREATVFLKEVSQGEEGNTERERLLGVGNNSAHESKKGLSWRQCSSVVSGQASETDNLESSFS